LDGRLLWTGSKRLRRDIYTKRDALQDNE